MTKLTGYDLKPDNRHPEFGYYRLFFDDAKTLGFSTYYDNPAISHLRELVDYFNRNGKSPLEVEGLVAYNDTIYDTYASHIRWRRTTMKPETEIYVDVQKWLKQNYPEVEAHWNQDEFGWDERTRDEKTLINPGYPDLFIAEPRTVDERLYFGLFVEIKRNDGWVDPAHLLKQATKIERLRDRGYAAFITMGLEGTKNRIAAYLGD